MRRRLFPQSPFPPTVKGSPTAKVLPTVKVVPAVAAALSATVLAAGAVVTGGGPALASSGAAAAPVAGAAGVARLAEPQVLRAGHTSGGTTWQTSSGGRTLPQLRANAVATADIRVNYSAGFSPAARAAFQAAVDIWKTQITSTVPITINATWTSLDTDILGQAGPVGFRRDFAGAPMAATYYPDALANALAGRDLDPTQPEIAAKFNSSFPAWYLGTDGRPDINHYDFESVVLHELGHGLGFVGTMDGLSPPYWTDQRRGYWGLRAPGDAPTVFDRLLVDGQGRDAMGGVYAQGSSALGALLRGADGGLQWKGPEGVMLSGLRPRLYSPIGFQEGSSVSHLDESLYPAGSSNALMTPYLQNGESAHDPGPLVRAMFVDMGWPSSSCTRAGGVTTDRFQPASAARRGTFAMSGGVTFNVPMLGRAGVPSSGVDAVLATVEIGKPTTSGWFMAGSGCGGTTATVQQYTAGVTRSALVSLPLDSLGRISLRLSGGAASVSVIVHGWYAPGGTTGLFTALPKTRINGPIGGVVTAGLPVDVAATGVAGIPSHVDAVVLNLTVVSPTASGNLLTGPGGVTPALADQAYTAGRSISQLVVVRPSSTGKIRLALSAGSARVYADAWGYYGPPSANTGDVTHRMVPTRVLNAAPGPDVTFTIPGLPANAHTVTLVTTVSGPTANGFLGAGPGSNRSLLLPGVVQYYVGQSIGNLAVVPVGPGGTVRLKLATGTGRLYADMLGYQAAS